MLVQELIDQLLKHDPHMPVMIQQGEEYDYMVAYSVKVKELLNMDEDDDDDSIVKAVVIEYS